MRRRYDMRRSDNYTVTETVSYVCSGSGDLNVITGFPVKSAIITFSTLPLKIETESDSSSSSSSSQVAEQGLPRIYVSGYLETGFTVRYENIPEDVGYIEFSYAAS